MNPGLLNKRIELQRVEGSSDGEGGYEKEPVTYAMVWASLVPKVVADVNEYDQTKASVSYIITIRQGPDIKITDQIRLGNRIFQQIAAPVDVLEQKRFWDLNCIEMVHDE